eukprot:scaffold136670_cov133-Phaeocystis_antarctica.AAC.1
MRARFARRSKQTRRCGHSTHHRVRAEARSTVTHEQAAHNVRRPTKTRPLAAGGATPRVAWPPQR